MRRLAFVLLSAVVLPAFGCVDPVHDELVAKLGPEDPNVPPGPLHRPGQPCLACHDGTGPAQLAFSIAGTIYQEATVAPTPELPNPPASPPLALGGVELVAADGRAAVFETNCAGNFYVQAVDWEPVFPVHVAIFQSYSPRPDPTLGVEMNTHIGRQGSCAVCHTGKETSTSNDHVYFASEPMTFPPTGCK